MAHTPGPWRASEGWPSHIYHVDMPGRKWSIGVARGDDEDTPIEQVRADAHLIAAAPDLLAALKKHMPWREEPVQGWGDWADAVAAIAKAEGRTDDQ